MPVWLDLIQKRNALLSPLAAERLLFAPQKPAPFALDRYGAHYLVTWLKGIQHPSLLKPLVEWLRTQNAASLSTLLRPKHGTSTFHIEWGTAALEPFVVEEGDLRFFVSLHEGQQTGLFLDHAPLRQWLRTRLHASKVLNLFAYTGSLSVAAALARNTHVTTLDLSATALRKAAKNLALNGITQSTLIQRDALEFLKQCKRQQTAFDCVILDPPTFSRDKKGKVQRTAKPLELLKASLSVVARGGFWIVSINTSSMHHAQFEALLHESLGERAFLTLKSLQTEVPTLGKSLPEYLKGIIFQVW